MRKILAVFLVLGCAAAPAAAQQATQQTVTARGLKLPSGRPLSAHEIDTKNASAPVSPWSEDDALARRLGIADGRAEFLDVGLTRSPLAPELQGSVDGHGAMMKLRWRLGG